MDNTAPKIVKNIKLPYNKGLNCFIFSNILRKDLEVMALILRDFEADQRDGFVSNVGYYIYSRCAELKAPYLSKDLQLIINKAYSETFQISQDIKQLLTLSE